MKRCCQIIEESDGISPTSLDTIASSSSLTASGVNVAAITMEEEIEERQQIKEWHNRVFKDIKNYECLGREELKRFRLADDK